MDYILDEVLDFLNGAEELLFIPYARPDGIGLDAYTALPQKVLGKAGIKVRGIQDYDDPQQALRQARAVFVGGGNTFLLLKTLYEKGLVEILRQVVEEGTPYMGSSAGSNITGLSIGTTNDMPIVYPPSFEALGLLPFNLNPHYLDPDPSSQHMGETRETRINEFHQFNSQPVVGLREGSWLRQEGTELLLKGEHSARVFIAGEEAYEQATGEVSIWLQSG